MVRKNRSKKSFIEEYKYIILITIILLGFFLRMYNSGGLSGGDDSEYAKQAMLILEGKINPFYIKGPDEPISWGNNYVFIRPMAPVPYTISVAIFGNTTFASKFPAALISTINILLLFIILKRYYSNEIALLASFFFAVNPFTIAFSRIGILNPFLMFYLLLIFLFVFKGFEEKKNYCFYLAGLFVLLSQLTTQFRGLVPLVGLLPYLYLQYRKKEKYWKVQFLHFFTAMALPAIAYIGYLLLPFLWGDHSFFEQFFVMAGKAVGRTETVNTITTSILYNDGPVFLTPFMGIIFIPALFGLYHCIKNIGDKINGVLVFSAIITPIPFFLQKQIAPLRQDIIVFAFVFLAATGIMIFKRSYIKEKSIGLSIMGGMTILYYIIILKIFPLLFPAEWIFAQQMMEHLNLYGYYKMVFSEYFTLFFLMAMICLTSISLIVYWIRMSKKTRRLLASAVIGIFLIFNLIIPIALTTTRMAYYYKPSEIEKIANYINNNLKEETYSCVAGIYDKSLYYYTEKPCAVYAYVNEEWMEEKADAGELSYFLINLYSVQGTWGLGKFNQDLTIDESSEGKPGIKNYPEKLEWLMANTVDVTEETGLSKDNPYFRLRRYVPAQKR
ncbi:glycosyltransferase family 39 protein [Candidatus Woesearchaeota archaeon]|nr:glycosyltransferase family 39 protein [Candidatus Woesearchaeota archaeon]